MAHAVEGSISWAFVFNDIITTRPVNEWGYVKQLQTLTSAVKVLFEEGTRHTVVVPPGTSPTATHFTISYTFNGASRRTPAELGDAFNEITQNLAASIHDIPDQTITITIDAIHSIDTISNQIGPPTSTAEMEEAIKSGDHFRRLSALALKHVNQGTTQAEFNMLAESMGLATAATTDKVPPELIKVGSRGLSQINLLGTNDSGLLDQQAHDDAQMVLTYLNARVAPDIIAAKPGGFDHTNNDDQLLFMAATANATAKYLSTNLAALETSKTIASADSVKKYNTDTIHMEFITDLFTGFSLPQDAITALTTVAKNFTANVANLSASSSQTDITTRQYVICSTLDSVPAQPNLSKESTLRTFLITFKEHTSEWSHFCSSGREYTLHTNNFSLEVGLNREIVRMMHDTLVKWCCSALSDNNQTFKPTDVEQLSKDNTTSVPGDPPM